MAIYKVIGVGEHGKYFDEESYSNVVGYAVDPSHACYAGCAGLESVDTAAEEMLDTAKEFHKNSGKRVRHSVLSFDERDNITPERANQFAQEIIQHYAPEYQIVYAVHDNTDDVHIHFVMNQISYVDGHRYWGKYEDFHHFGTI